jgi:hypothetical protein
MQQFITPIIAVAAGLQAALMFPGLHEAFPSAAPVMQAAALGLTVAIGVMRMTGGAK